MNKMLKNLLYVVLFFALISILPKVTTRLQKFAEQFDPRAKVAVIKIEGTIYDSSSLNKQLLTYFKDKDIKAILLKLECSGSAAGSGEILFREINTLKKKYPKPIISFVENLCASGGYYIASATDYIIAPGSSVIGSIGNTFSYMFDINKLLKQNHIEYSDLKAGEYKLSTNPFVARTDQDKQMLQSVLDSSYEQFVSDIATARRLSLKSKDQWANGRLFTGKQALKLGLIDKVGGPTDVIEIIKEKALIDKEIKWVRKKKKTSFWDMWKKTDDSDKMFSFVNALCTYVESRYCNAGLKY